MIKFIKAQTNTEVAQNFQRISKNLTAIPYFEGIERLPDTTFSKMDTLFFPAGQRINVQFLKRELFLKYLILIKFFSLGKTQMVCQNGHY